MRAARELWKLRAGAQSEAKPADASSAQPAATGVRLRSIGRWSAFEGRSRYNGGSAPGAVPPVIRHTHAAGWCSIVGGYVMRDPTVPALAGRYVYGDLCQPRLYAARLRSHSASDRRLGLTVPELVSFGEDAAGHVYAVSLNGPVYRVDAR